MTLQQSCSFNAAKHSIATASGIQQATYHSPIVRVLPLMVTGVDQRGALISLLDRPFMAYCMHGCKTFVNVNTPR